jgi:hypothetical protein
MKSTTDATNNTVHTESDVCVEAYTVLKEKQATRTAATSASRSPTRPRTAL